MMVFFNEALLQIRTCLDGSIWLVVRAASGIHRTLVRRKPLAITLFWRSAGCKLRPGSLTDVSRHSEAVGARAPASPWYDC